MITTRIPGLLIIKRRFQLVLQFLISATPTFHYGLAFFSISFFFGFSATMRDLLTPTSSDIFALRVWKLVSSPLVEPNFLIFAWSIVSLQQFIVYIKPSWGVVEILKYLGIVQLITIVIIATLALISFATFGALNFFFYARICGLPIVGISALVSLKQFLPDTVILTTPYGRLKNGHLPLSSLFTCVLLCMFGLLRGSVPIQVAVGLQVSWTYLRFFRVSGTVTLVTAITESDEQQGLLIVGDESEHFTWASFFPRRLQPLANIVGNAMFHMLVVLKICKRLKDLDLNHIDDALQSTFVIDTGVMESRDAERKRQRALRVLNERLSSVVSTRIGDNLARPMTSSSSPRLPSDIAAAPTCDGAISSTNEAADIIVKSTSQQDFARLGHGVVQQNSNLNEHLYGVASQFTSPDTTSSRLLTRMDSEFTAEINDPA